MFVDGCENVYVAGYGSHFLRHPMPLKDEYMKTTDDFSFYLMALSKNATDLTYATYFSSSGNDHVDAGHSYFNKDAVLFQAVCTGGTDFPTSSGSWSTGSHFGLYDICALKFDFEGCELITHTDTTPAKVCHEIFVPSAFSPNDDRDNDTLFVRGDCIKSMHFRIYDRWGINVFSSGDPATGWTGTDNGTKLGAQVFFYSLEATMNDNKVVYRQGNISLIR